MSVKKTFASLAFVAAALLAIVTAGNSKAFAQERRWDDLGGWLSISIERQLEFEGYRDGVNVGRNDAYAHRPSNPRESKWFRDGNEEYREGFRRGYDEGYKQAARRLAENAEIHMEQDGYQDGLNCGRSDALAQRPSNPESSRYFRDGNGEYREGFRRGYGEGYHQGQQRLAAKAELRLEEDGYQDGINCGRNDALAYRPPNPGNSKAFRDGNGEYREGFQRGYAEGYREGLRRLER